MDFFYNQLKKIDVGLQTREFLWKVSHCGLPVGEIRRLWDGVRANEVNCVLCSRPNQLESFHHLFLDCTEVVKIYDLFRIIRSDNFKKEVYLNGDDLESYNFWAKALIKHEIWLYRNKLVFDKDRYNFLALKIMITKCFQKELSIQWYKLKPNVDHFREKFIRYPFRININQKDEVDVLVNFL